MSVALGGAVELGDVLDAEPLDEFCPDLRPQTVAEDEADFVLLLLWTFRSAQEITAKLSDVLAGLKNVLYFERDLNA